MEIRTMDADQYQQHGGLIVDMDTEHIMSYVTDRDYTDDLLDKAFWVIVETYFRDDVAEVTYRYSVQELIEHDKIVDVLDQMHVWHKVIDTSDLDFPRSLFEWFDGVQYAAMINTPFGPTDLVPGLTESHALVLSVMQRARQLSSLNLNPGSYGATRN